MRLSRSFVIAAGLSIAAGPAWAQEAKQAKPQPRAAEAERVGQFLEQHAKADPAWATKQCIVCHVVPEKARALIVSRQKDKTSSVRVVEPHYFEYHENAFQPNEYQLVTVFPLDRSSQALDGLSVAPVDDSLKQHLKIPDHQGLVVTSIDTNSPSHMAGVFLHDILLKVDDKPVGSSKDLVNALRGAEGKSLSLTVMRRGKPRVIRVKPRVKIILEAAGDETPEFPKFWIGVSVGPVEPALRTQLDILDPLGLSVLSVHPGSPADKAGLKRGDVLIRLGGWPLDSPLRLRKVVETFSGHHFDLLYYRDGEVCETKVLPVPYKPDPSAAKTVEPIEARIVFESLPVAPASHTYTFPGPNLPAASPDLTNRLNALDAELREVRSSLRKIEQALGKLGAVQK